MTEAETETKMIRGGRSIVSAPPAFSNDAKNLLICTGNTISVFSTSTGLQVTELEGHTSAVTSVVVVPSLTPASKILCYCWTASLDGTIRYWDFSAPELMKTINIQFPIYCMVIPNFSSEPAESGSKEGDLFAYLSIEKENGQEMQKISIRGQICKCNLTKGRLAGGVTLAETSDPELITVCNSSRLLGIRDKRKLRLWKLTEKEPERANIKKIVLHHTKKLTVLAFHPSERIVAAGDATGRILIWRGVGNRTFAVMNGGLTKSEEDRPGVRGDDDADSCTTLHWHSAEVNLLFFSSDGAYLYSGGKEGVLVLWHLDTGKKRFLPRIGSPLKFFLNSSDPSLASISCTDNRVHLLKMPSMEILKTISGIKPPSFVSKAIGSSNSRFAFDTGAGLVALLTENYCIQLFSLLDDREISEVQVCERNHQPGDEITVIITLVAISQDGSLMSTVENRLPEEEIGGLVCLKFWECQPLNKDFSLSTIIYEPHRDGNLSAIAFHPTRRITVSCSYGGDFKVWVENNAAKPTDNLLKKNGWTCHAVGSYKNKPMTAAAFCLDGSVLAVAAETVITLWDPLKNVLISVIGDSLEPISSLSFVSSSEYLVSASRGSNAQLSVWKMANLSLDWSYKIHIEALAYKPNDASSFAVLAILTEAARRSACNKIKAPDVDGAILLFNAADPVPVATWFVRKAAGGGIAFLNNTSEAACENMITNDKKEPILVYMNGDHEYVLFDLERNTHSIETVISSSRVNDVSTIQQTEQGGGYLAMYGELPEFEMKTNNSNDPSESAPFVPSGRPWETIFSGSTHSLPPLTKLCASFLESLLEMRSTTTTTIE
ncbi:WD repeat-containing protein 75-like isoform X2 [Impatiens glandulifera]|uniref:WD repeat-containing protein 75-like isoform X2 n=1 Tax=Impatiens glandulifera TaxID=253017 RepID=UPI001FB147E6|nr:WD repeat-containing protein 75-like isoform X2 [Impatiens glandulifera]